MASISCADCNGECCRDISIEIDKPEDADDFDQLKWFLAHKNITVYIDHEDSWMVDFKTDCKFLDENNRCKIYSNRYIMCSDHDPEECVMNGEGNHYKRIFRTAEDVDEYMKEINFYEKYLEESAKRKNNAKLS